MEQNELNNEVKDPDVMEQYVAENYNIVEPQNRFRSWAVWVSVLGALWTICNALGLTAKWGIEEGTFKTIVDALGVILIGFGILNDPTNKIGF